VGGFAKVPDAPVLTMSQLAADILALLDHLEVKEAIFVGCSSAVMFCWSCGARLLSG